jgi:hypothetical protein
MAVPTMSMAGFNDVLCSIRIVTVSQKLLKGANLFAPQSAD